MSTQAQQPGALGLIAARWPRLTAGASAGGAGETLFCLNMYGNVVKINK